MRSREFRRRTREEAVREYFYGKRGSKNALFPFSFEVPFSSVSIYKIGGKTYVHVFILSLHINFVGVI